MTLFMCHNLLDCGTGTLCFQKTFISQNSLHPKLRKSYVTGTRKREGEGLQKTIA